MDGSPAPRSAIDAATERGRRSKGQSRSTFTSRDHDAAWKRALDATTGAGTVMVICDPTLSPRASTPKDDETISRNSCTARGGAGALAIAWAVWFARADCSAEISRRRRCRVRVDSGSCGTPAWMKHTRLAALLYFSAEPLATPQRAPRSTRFCLRGCAEGAYSRTLASAARRQKPPRGTVESAHGCGPRCAGRLLRIKTIARRKSLGQRLIAFVAHVAAMESSLRPWPQYGFGRQSNRVRIRLTRSPARERAPEI